jgi:hypothetical protein
MTTHCEISFTTSNKGKPLLIHNSYVFKCNKTTLSKKYWICNDPVCGVSLHTNMENQFLLVTGNHDHAVEPESLDIKLLKDKMKERILSETTSITKIYDEEVKKALLSDAAVAGLPTVFEYRMYF